MTLPDRKNMKLVWLGVFAVSMGFLEAIVVVYLRGLYYPEGFEFPLRIFPETIYLIELLRELSTLLMLFAVGYLTGKDLFHKFSCFLLAFGIWDVFYYIALKLLLGWPGSLLDWDILFLIPVTWAGPVLAPLICSALMIILGLMIHSARGKGYLRNYNRPEWILMLSGASLVFLAFIRDYTLLITGKGFFRQGTGLFDNPEFVRAITEYVPDRFCWEIFLPGIALIGASIASYAVSYKHWLNTQDEMQP